MEEQVLTLIKHISKKSGGHCGASVAMLASRLDVRMDEVQDAVCILLAEGKIVERKSLNALIYFPNDKKRINRRRI